MLILGIESSCDETGIALFNTKTNECFDALYSQIDMHRLYGGVVPELASRDHIRKIIPLLDEVVEKSGAKKEDIDAVAVTEGPGLAGALLVGTSVGYAIGLALNIPVIGVHHLEGHLLSPLLSGEHPAFPFIALLVSGGHTQIMKVESPGHYEILGETLDDAAGEVFDKTAQAIGECYPGGPAVSRMAELGLSGVIDLPRPLLHAKNYDFSFSGLKTAVMNTVRHAENSTDETFKNNLCRAFVDSVTEVLVTKTLRALRDSGYKHLVVAGGVSANKQLRKAFQEACRRHHIEVFFPPAHLCTDNGAMIALAGAYKLERERSCITDADFPNGFNIKPRWPLTS